MRRYSGRSQEPLADALELLAPPNLLGVQPAQQITERRHNNETKGRGLAGPVGGFGNNNTATVNGNNSSARSPLGNNNTAIITGDNLSAFAGPGNDNTVVVP